MKITYKKIINRLYKLAYKPHSIDTSIKTLFEGHKNICLLDIGANAGQTIEWGMRMFEKVEIYSFEPTRDLFQGLETKYKEYNNVHLFNLAISDHNGRQNFYTSSHSLTNSLLKPKIDLYQKYMDRTRLEKFNLTSQEMVEVLKLDDWYTNTLKGKQIDILKIDTQGNDYFVLLGAEELLKSKVRIIIIEIEFTEFYEGTAPFYNILKLLTNYGFSVYSIFDNTRLPGGQLIESNFIFIKKIKE